MRANSPLRSLLLITTLLLFASAAVAHEPDYTTTFNQDGCSFSSTGNNPYFPLWPGHTLVLEGEEDDDGELVEISATITVLAETELVDGVLTRVVEERELEDGELVEISRNFFAHCRETGDVWYFGEDVDDYEDGEVVGHEGAWRAGVNGAKAGIQMPGTPLVGARYFEEVAPGVALDRGEILSLDEEVDVPAGSFEGVVLILDTDALDPESEGEKYYAPGVGNVIDEELELVDFTPAPCQPDATTHCLANGRFMVQVEWDSGPDDDGDDSDGEGDDGEGDDGEDDDEGDDGEDDDEGEPVGPGMAILASDTSGEFWFFNPNNTELLVKVIDACDNPDFNSFWVFAAGLTDVEVELTVTDTATNAVWEYENEVGTPFPPVFDTQAFPCP